MSNTKADLLKIIAEHPLEKIKELINTKGIPVDESWLDYAALNLAIEQGRKDLALFLIDKKCRVNKVSRLLGKSSSTPLHNAVKLGDSNLVQKLLDRNASMTAMNSKGNSPLHLAFLLKHEKLTDLILDFILKTATFSNPKNSHGLTHFHIACARQNASLAFSYMNNQANFSDIVHKDSPYFAGYTVMQFAVESRSPLILKLVLEHSGNVLCSQTQSTLELAKQHLQDMSVMVYLLSGYTQSTPQKTMSQFHMACAQDNPLLVSKFLGFGAEVNNPISEEASFCPLYTPLHYSVEINSKENVEILLQHGADVSFQNTQYMTPLHLSLYNENPQIFELLYAATKNKLIERTDRIGLSYFHAAIAKNDLEIVEKFLDRGQDVNCRVYHNNRNFSGFTPMHFAVRYEHLCMAKLLRERGGNVNASDMGQHGTPLHMAVASGHIGLIEFLLNVGARVDIKRPNDGKTMLHLLVECIMEGTKRPKFLNYIRRFVLDYGLDVNNKDNEGYTALHYACTKISIGANCAKVLLDFGADINIENNVGDTPFDLSFYDVYRHNAVDYMILYNHVKGLKTLGFNVNPKNDECCEKLLNEKDECQKEARCFKISQFVKTQQDYVNEVLKMKATMVSEGITMYQFILLDEKQLRYFGSCNILKNLVEGKMIDEFVNFGYLVKLQWAKLKRVLQNMF